MKDIFENSFKLIIDKFVLGIPNFLMAMLLAIVGYMIAKFVSKMIKKILVTLKVDKFGDMFNNIDVISKNKIGIKISEIVSKFFYYVLFMIFLIAATDVLQMEALSNLVKSIIEFIPNLVVAMAILIIGILIADKLRAMIQTTCESLGIPSGKVIASFVFYFVFITIFIMALSQAKIDTNFMAQNISIIIAGVVLAFSIGYGFASKELVSNYIAAFSTKGKYNIGDVLTIGEIKGTVEAIDRTSIVLSVDGDQIIIPLKKLLNENIRISS